MYVSVPAGVETSCMCLYQGAETSCMCPYQGAETSCMCVCIKRVGVSNTEPKACTVGIYSTLESRYLYSPGEYICLLLIVYLKISLKCM